MKNLARRLESYTAFIVFHGCRPIDTSSYYISGLQPSNLDTINEVARRTFLSPDNIPVVTEQALTAAVESMSRFDHGKLYVVLDDRYLINRCGQYMIYGSEHLCGIGASLGRVDGLDYRQVLKRFGTPTVIRLRLPRTLVSQNQVEELAQFLHEGWEEDRGLLSPPELNCTFGLRDTIPPENVLGHFHPERILDPLLYFSPYCYQDETVEQPL